MLKFCVHEKYRLPALTKHAEYLKVKEREERKILSEVGNMNIKKLIFSGYSKILLAGPNANLNSSLQVRVEKILTFNK